MNVGENIQHICTFFSFSLTHWRSLCPYMTIKIMYLPFSSIQFINRAMK